MEKVHPSSPHAPTDGGKGAHASPPPRAYEEETLLRLGIDQFTQAEINSFVHLSEFARPNPRKIKRITNTYILARFLLPPDADLRNKTLAWIILCEQWPVRVAWILQSIKDNQQQLGEVMANLGGCPLYEYYCSHVEKIVFSPMAGDQIRNPNVRKQYVDAYAMDYDPELFEVFLRKVNLKVGDVDELAVGSPRTKLSTYTISLSPGIRALIARIASIRVQEESVKKVRSKDYQSMTLLGNTRCRDIQAKKRMDRFLDMGAIERRCNYMQDREDDTSVEAQTRDLLHGLEERHEEAKKAFKADQVGKDFVSYTDYARAIAQLVVGLVETPCVFGLSGVWGTGKSFTMNKITTYIKACSISQIVHMHGEDDEHYDLLQKLAVLARDDGQMKLVYKWLMTGADRDAIGTGAFPCLDKGVVNSKWATYKATAGSYDGDTDILTLIYAVFALMTFLGKAVRWAFRKICNKTPQNGPLDLLRKAWLETKTKGDEGVNYEFVWFNAWTFCSGSEALWAGLVLKLHEGVEKHFGPAYAHAEYRARMIVATAKIMAAMLFFLVGIVLIGPTDWASLTMELETIATDAKVFCIDLLQKFAGISICGFSLAAWARQGLTFFTTPSTPSRSLRERATKFKGRLGFMDEVRMEIEFLSRILRHPKEMPTFWDLIVPNGWTLLGSVVKRLKKLLWKPPNKSPRKCRIVLFVDDLDRCAPARQVEVLQALVLINHNTPFITFLAADPRILVNAIETNYKGFYRESGVTGYEYLEKMIQVPFSFPPLSEYDKSKLFRGFLTGQAEADHVEFVDMDQSLCRYELAPDRSGITVRIRATKSGEDFVGQCSVIKFAEGVLFNGHSSSRLPYSVAESLVRQLVSLASRCSPPCLVQLGGSGATVCQPVAEAEKDV